MEKIILEIGLFNIFESAFFILYYLLKVNKKVNIGKFSFHLVMLSVLNWFLGFAIPIAIAYQIIYLIAISIYFHFVFYTKFKDNLIITFQALGIMFLTEIPFIIMYDNVFNFGIAEMSNGFTKFLFFLPIRLTEVTILCILKNKLYLRRKSHEEVNKGDRRQQEGYIRKASKSTEAHLI